MSKILFVIPRMGGGGAERVVATIANGLVKSGEIVEILTFVKGESFYPLNDGVVLSDCGIKSVKKGKLRKLSLIFHFPKAFFRARRKIKKGGYDVVISFLREADITLYFIRKTGIKFRWIASERNDPRNCKKIKRKLLNKAYKKVDAFVCQGERVKQFYSFIPEEKKTVIFNPVDFSNVGERADAKKRVVAVGRLSEQKNFAMLIKAFCNLHNEFPEHTLTIYGEGRQRENLEDLIARLDAKNYVFLPGADKNVCKKISDAELFVLSSDYEGFPNALTEAAAMGLPCISTDFYTGSAEYILPDEKAIIPVGDQKALEEAVRLMLSDGDFAAKCGENNKLNSERFSAEKIVGEWKKIIKKVEGKAQEQQGEDK